jgi:hypothetical protein
MVHASLRWQASTLRHYLQSQQFYRLTELITIHTNVSLRGAYIKAIVYLLDAFFNSFPLETDFFFCNF